MPQEFFYDRDRNACAAHERCCRVSQVVNVKRWRSWWEDLHLVASVPEPDAAAQVSGVEGSATGTGKDELMWLFVGSSYSRVYERCSEWRDR